MSSKANSTQCQHCNQPDFQAKMLEFMDRLDYRLTALEKMIWTKRDQPPTQPAKGIMSSAARMKVPCFAYNTGSCPQDLHHNNLRHCCAYCLMMVKKECRHPMSVCNRKKTHENEGRLSGEPVLPCKQ